MARVKKEKESIAIIDPTVKLKPKIKYFAKFLNYHFDYEAVDENGKPKIKMNNQGTPIYDAEGNVQVITLQKSFSNLVNRAKVGYLSCFEYDPNDISAQNIAIGEALAELSEQRNVPVMTEDDYDKSTNAAMFEEKKRARELESEVATLRAENEKLKSPEELERRLNELTGK